MFGSEETRVMRSQPTGDYNTIPASLRLQMFDDLYIEAILLTIAEVAKTMDAWVGLNVMSTAKVMGNPGVGSLPYAHPLAWMKLNDRHPLVQAIRYAEENGWVTLDDGFVYPTQQLVDILITTK